MLAPTIKENTVFCKISGCFHGRFLLFMVSFGTIALGNAQEPIANIRVHPDGCGARFVPDGQNLLTLCPDGTIKLLDVRTTKEIMKFEGHKGSLCSVAFSPDGKTLAASSGDPGEIVWDIGLYPFRFNYRERKPFGTITLWDVPSGKKKTIVETGEDVPGPIAFSDAGKSLLYGTESGGVKTWSIHAGREVQSRQGLARDGPFRDPNIPAFTSDGRFRACGTYMGKLKLWDDAKGQSWIADHKPHISCVVFSPNQRFLATGGSFTAKLWDVQTGKELASLGSYDHCISDLAFSPDGKIIATAHGIVERPGAMPRASRIRFWDVVTKKELASVVGPCGEIDGLDFSPNGQLLATSSRDGTVLLWRVSFPKKESN